MRGETPRRRREKRREAVRLEPVVEDVRDLVERMGLEPYPVKYWIVDYDEVNRAVAYGGFQERYPHWRWGMEYEKLQKMGQYTPSRIYELVVNDSPSHAYLQVTNDVADQKAVVSHVEAHADFFARNRWFREFTEGFDAAATLARHAETLEGFARDPDVDREEVERWMDDVLTLEDNVDQYSTDVYGDGDEPEGETRDDLDRIREQVEEMGLSDEVEAEIFREEWLRERSSDGEPDSMPAEPEKDLLRFLADHGMAYDEETGKAVEMEDWQREVIEMVRRESYYFAPQKMTKVMNEGWAAYWESMAMGNEALATEDEFLDYADHQSKVLSSSGFNPYKLGKEMWEYVENRANREEVVGRLLRVDGVTASNLRERVDLDRVLELLEPEYPLEDVSADTLDDLARLDESKLDLDNLERARAGELDVDRQPWKLLSYRGLAERNYSLVRRQNRGFLRAIDDRRLEEIERYVVDVDRYASVEEALADVDHAAGWDEMRDVRETHNDVTFVDAYLTDEFVRRNEYFAYEYSHATEAYHVSSREPEDVKKKLLLRLTNFGKPTVKVHDSNYDNAGELLLAHHYNGVPLDLEEARDTLERVHSMWGRPVNLKTVVHETEESSLKIARRRGNEPRPEERGLLLRYDGEAFDSRELSDDEVEDIMASDLDYDTKPDDWLE